MRFMTSSWKLHTDILEKSKTKLSGIRFNCNLVFVCYGCLQKTVLTSIAMFQHHTKLWDFNSRRVSVLFTGSACQESRDHFVKCSYVVDVLKSNLQFYTKKPVQRRLHTCIQRICSYKTMHRSVKISELTINR